MSAQGFFGRMAILVGRAVWAMLHPERARSVAAELRAIDPSLQEPQIRQIRRQAHLARETAATATRLIRTEAGFDPDTGAALPGGPAPPGETHQLGEVLSARRRPGANVRVWIKYEVILPGNRRDVRSVLLGRADDPGGPVTWETTMEQLRARVQDAEAGRDATCSSGTIDWATLEFIPPLLYPPSP